MEEDVKMQSRFKMVWVLFSEGIWTFGTPSAGRDFPPSCLSAHSHSAAPWPEHGTGQALVQGSPPTEAPQIETVCLHTPVRPVIKYILQSAAGAFLSCGASRFPRVNFHQKKKKKQKNLRNLFFDLRANQMSPAGFYYDIKLSAWSHSTLSVHKLKVAQVWDKHFQINMR